MRLYIAEKPSMALEITKCLFPKAKRQKGYFSDGTNYITWAYGHILHQAKPENYDEKYKKWNIKDLPIIPSKWKMIVTPNSAEQFYIISDLIKMTDEIIHAGDPDREGQLLIDEILDFLDCQKPVKRILLNALDKDSIIEANNSLRLNKEFFNLKQSALARARADWLIGMNLSRAYTLAARRSGKKQVLPVGRVKTPTLSLIVRRERELENFIPVNYFPIKAIFEYENVNFSANWKPGDTQKGLDSENRLINSQIAEGLLERFNSSSEKGKIQDYKKQLKKEAQRLPFSLSTLQVLAGKKFGMEPQQVLDTAQSLYEKKLTTYPRSDCEYLPTNQFYDAKIIIKNLINSNNEEVSAWAKNANTREKSRCWNDSKISAHHAIIPTKVLANMEKLTPTEKQIYYLIAQAYLAQFYPVHTFYQTQISILFEDETFTTSGRVIKEIGWKALYRKIDNEENTDEDNSADASLPIIKKNNSIDFVDSQMDSKFTKPPQRFTASTLLLAMKEIHKYVKNQELKKKLKDVYGIGTEATRAGIIEDLEKRGFVETTGKKKYLIPTNLAYLLIDSLPDEMTYPDSTALWEDYLQGLSKGNGSIEEFLKMQIQFAKQLCDKASTTIMVSEDKKENICPRCKKGILVLRNGKNGAFWGCSNFPNCKMTCNDNNGNPDWINKKNYKNYSINCSNYNMDGGFISAQELIAQNSKTNLKNKYYNKEKYSAAPQEKTVYNQNNSNKYACPRCKTGNLRKILGKNGIFWGCTNYPHCTSTFDDKNGMPILS